MYQRDTSCVKRILIILINDEFSVNLWEFVFHSIFYSLVYLYFIIKYCFFPFYLDHDLTNNIHSIVAVSMLFAYSNWPNPIIITPDVPNFQIVYPQTISWSYIHVIPIIIVSKHCNIISTNILLSMSVYG